MDWEGWLQVLPFIPVATIISITVTLLIRYADRPRAVFVAEMQLNPESDATRFYRERGLAKFTVALVNAGDGPAYQLEVFGDHCDAAILAPTIPGHSTRWAWRRPVVQPGEELAVECLAARSDSAKAMLVIRWRSLPGRPWSAATRQLLQVPVSALDSANFFPAGVLEPTALPRWFRRWRRLELYTARGRDWSGRARKARAAQEPPPEQSELDQPDGSGEARDGGE